MVQIGNNLKAHLVQPDSALFAVVYETGWWEETKDNFTYDLP